MKRIRSFLLIVGVVAGIAAVDVQKQTTPAQIIRGWYQNSTDDILISLKEFRDTVMQADRNQITLSYSAFRKVYKKVEFLISYLHPQDFTTNINGAPLKKTAIDTDSPEILDPAGIQVIDELIVEDHLSKQEILQQINKLIGHFDRLNRASKHQVLYDRHIIEAIRQNITYITTLSLSGFDTPGSLLGLFDASNAMHGMRWCIQQYEQEITATDDALFNQVDQLFERGINALEGANFENFDRFTYTRDILNPLNEKLLLSQMEMGVELRHEVDFLAVPVNHQATHVFARDFLSDAYFKPAVAEHHEEILALGKVLFFDPILSANNERACASCHDPDRAFSEELSKSLAFDGKIQLKRNSMTLVNAVYAHDFFYDLRAGDLSMQFEHVVTNPGEFNTTYHEVRKKINDCDEYEKLFETAFNLNGKPIRKDHINRALKIYVASLVAMDSPFDKMMRGEKEATLEVKQGYNLFMGKANCGTCHFPPTFSGLRPPDYTDTESEVLGVPVSKDFDHTSLDEDSGRFASGRPLDWMPHHLHSFKTVTVRNVELSGPYFHNGSVPTLEEVIDFYNRGGGQGLGLCVPNQTLSGDSLGLTEIEMQQIINFLHSLTDVGHLTDVPKHLPECNTPNLTGRNIGGKY